MTIDGCPKVTDFGLARSRPVSTDIIPADQSALVSFAGGTAAYCSPEQARGKKLSRKTDIWSWAVTVLHMFIGDVVWRSGLQAPQVLQTYRGFFGPKFLVRMPKQLAKLLESCLSGRVDERPKDMQEVASCLMEIYQAEFNRPYNRKDFKAVDHAAAGLNNRALSLLDLGQTERAEQLWQEALRVDPEHLESVYNSGLHHWRAGQIDDQVLAMRLRMSGAKAITPRHALLAAQVELESDDVESAIELLKPVATDKSADSEIRALSGLAQKRIQDSMRCIRTVELSACEGSSSCLSRDGRYALTGGAYHTVRLWDSASGQCLRVFGERARVHRQQDQDTANQEDSMDWDGFYSSVMSVCLSEDNRYAMSGGQDNTLRVWDVTSGECLQTLEGHTGSVESVYLSKDGRFALSGSRDRTLRSWDMDTGRSLSTFEGHTGSVDSVCLSEDNRYALSGSGDNTVRLWDVSSGSCLRIFKGHTGWVKSVRLSEGNRYALSGGGDKTVRLWELATGRCLRTFKGHTGGVRSVWLSGNNRYALSGSSDKT
ncbi:MAG: tetratricopeptide repeat protein, partial [Verrucomicrobiota bacterium]